MLGILSLLFVGALAAERPIGDADKRMYEAFVLGRIQAEPAETLPVSTGVSLGLVAHRRWAVGGTVSFHAPEGGGGRVTIGDRSIELEPGYELRKVRPEVSVERTLRGSPAQGWLASGGVGWLGMTSWPGGVDTSGRLDAEDLKARGGRAGVFETRLGTGYRWTFHPGAVFHLEAGVRARTFSVGATPRPDVPTLVPYLQVATGAAFAPGGAPRAGYRARRNTGRVKPETIIGLAAVSLVQTAVAAGLTVNLYTSLVRTRPEPD